MLALGYVVAAGALIRGYGAYREGLDRAAFLRQNAKELERSAQLVLAQGRTAAKNIAREGEIDQARIINATRAAGFTMYGSPLTLYVAAVLQNELESRNTLTTARLQADAMLRRAKALRAQASSAKRGAFISAISGGIIAGGAVAGDQGGDGSRGAAAPPSSEVDTTGTPLL